MAIKVEKGPSMTREECLKQAATIVTGDREASYGSPEDNFKAIAAMWTAYLWTIKRKSLEPHDVAAMMSMLKLARIGSGNGKADNWIDLAGYAACGAELQSKSEN